MQSHWTLDDIPWDQFDPTAIDPEVVKAVKAAAMVEHNGADYEVYLHRVFKDDPAFCEAVSHWAEEEVRHGEALGRWARMADPDFDFDGSFARFREGFSLPLDAAESVRGSRTGELIARCMVEIGTSSFYSALRDATDEPVLKKIAGNIAGDEFRHFKLFFDTMRRYQEREKIGLARRLWIAVGRALESEDDELAYAYYSANGGAAPYDRRQSVEAYARRAYRLYRYGHVARGLGMAFKAIGLRPRGRLSRTLSNFVWRAMQFRVRRLERVAP